MSGKFKVLLRVRYAECDAQNVVFNARYGDYVDLAATEFMRKQLGGYDKLLAQGVDSQVVRLAIDWKSSATFDDVILIELEVRHIGNSSYSFSLAMSDHLSGREIANAEIIYVVVSSKGYVAMPIPDYLRDALSKEVVTEIVNYSGLTLD